MAQRYDYLVVGAGLFGCVFARIMKDAGYDVMVMDRRNHTGGNCYTEEVEGIMVHRYGPHIFHTNNKKVWDFMNRYTVFNNFINRPIAMYGPDVYSLPFNMYTFNKLFGVVTPEEAMALMERETRPYRTVVPQNLEEQALSMVGSTLYNILVKGYTQKQWDRPCTELPPEIIKRLPLRFTYDNNYYNAEYQGIPDYVALFSQLLRGIPFALGCDYLEDKEYNDRHAKRVLFTGPIDEFFEYELGALEYRSLRFESQVLQVPDYQGNAVVNYTGSEVPWTRIVEHKHFSPVDVPCTVITKEFSQKWTRGTEPFYPINDERNNWLYQQYQEFAKEETDVIFGGRLGEYRYYDMDVIVEKAMQLAAKEIAHEWE